MNTFVEEKIRLLMRLRNCGVTDTRVLSAIEGVPRDQFVPEEARDMAYEDIALPITDGVTISQPSLVGLMISVLDVPPRGRVLEIGTGTGYQTAILSKLCRMVYTMERDKEILQKAEERLKDLGISNVVAIHGDGVRGWDKASPFDRIIVTAAAKEIPSDLIDQLDDGGIMVIPVGPEGDQILVRLKKTGRNIETQHLMRVTFVPLVPLEK